MIRKSRAALPALYVMLAACAAAPNSPPVRTVEITPSAALDDDLKKLDDLVLRRDFLAIPTRRDRVETSGQPVDVLRTYEFRDRRALRLSIGWELRRSRYRIFVTDFGRAPAPAWSAANTWRSSRTSQRPSAPAALRRQPPNPAIRRQGATDGPASGEA